jgi:hypothetical protein
MSPTEQVFVGILMAMLTVVTVVAWYYRNQLTKEHRTNHPIRAQLRDLTDQYNEIYKRSGEYFTLIEGAQKERDGWRRLYQDSTLAAGNAQNLFMVERARNFQLLVGNGIKPFRDKVIDQLVGAYMEEHYEPVKQSAEKDREQKSSEG